jgi:hypothetical protein
LSVAQVDEAMDVLEQVMMERLTRRVAIEAAVGATETQVASLA